MEENKNFFKGIAVIALVLALASLYWVYSISKNANPSQDNQQNQNQNQAQTVQVNSDDAPVTGDPNAPITIIEFSDFQCPFCGKFVSDSWPQIEQNYIKTGKAKLIFRNYPLPFHPFAKKAAEATQCALEQGKFWEMHDKLFANQTALTITDLKKYAGQLGLDTTKFNDCLDSGKYTAVVQKDYQDGANYGIEGTPSFFIGKSSGISIDPAYVKAQSQANIYVFKTGNASVVIGAQPFSVFQKAIDEALAK